MTDEGSGLIEKYIPQYDVLYPMVRASNKDYGVSGYPTFFLVGPDGKVLSTGHGVPKAAAIGEALRNVSLLPDLPTGGVFSAILRDWKKRRFAKVLDRVEGELEKEKLAGEQRGALEKLEERLEKMQTSAGKRIEKLKGGPDYYAAHEALSQIEDEWDGRELAEQAATVLDTFDRDPVIKTEVRAGAALAKLRDQYDPSSIGPRRKLTSSLETFLKRYADTHAAGQAKILIASLRRM